LKIAEASPVADGPGWWLRFVGLGDRSAVEHLRDVYLETHVTADDRAPGTWRWHELVGLAVRGSDGRQLGTIREIYRAGGAEVFVVRGPNGEIDVPAVSHIVLELAPERGEVVVDVEVLDLAAPVVDETSGARPKAPRRRPGSRRRTAGPSIPPDAAPPEPA
jgi:ribosomal 30S subunit maturation factor RimM